MWFKLHCFKTKNKIFSNTLQTFLYFLGKIDDKEKMQRSKGRKQGPFASGGFSLSDTSRRPNSWYK